MRMSFWEACTFACQLSGGWGWARHEDLNTQEGMSCIFCYVYDMDAVRHMWLHVFFGVLVGFAI